MQRKQQDCRTTRCETRGGPKLRRDLARCSPWAPHQRARSTPSQGSWRSCDAVRGGWVDRRSAHLQECQPAAGPGPLGFCAGRGSVPAFRKLNAMQPALRSSMPAIVHVGSRTPPKEAAAAASAAGFPPCHWRLFANVFGTGDGVMCTETKSTQLSGSAATLQAYATRLQAGHVHPRASPTSLAAGINRVRRKTPWRGRLTRGGRRPPPHAQSTPQQMHKAQAASLQRSHASSFSLPARILAAHQQFLLCSGPSGRFHWQLRCASERSGQLRRAPHSATNLAPCWLVQMPGPRRRRLARCKTLPRLGSAPPLDACTACSSATYKRYEAHASHTIAQYVGAGR